MPAVEFVPQTFEQEAMPHLDDLYRTATRLTRSRTDAEDLIQEVYMQAWKSFANYEAGTNCRAWLYKILFNKFDHYRRKKLTESKRIIEAADDFVFENTAVEPVVSEHLTDEEIICAVDKLPAHYRSVVLLADVQEFAYKEIAEILAIPIGTVMSRLNRGRAELRSSLAKVAGEYGIGTGKMNLIAVSATV